MPRRQGVGTQRSLALAIIVCTVAILSATVATAKFVSWAQARDGTGTFLTAQSSTHLVKTTSNDYARLAITVATSLTTIALAAVPVSMMSER